MKKQIVKKIILGVIIFTFAMFFLQAILPSQTSAANAPLNGLWDNPNTGKSPYKFNVKTVLNSDIIMQVVGCTGIVDKISAKVTTFIKDLASGKLKKLKAEAKEKLAKASACQFLATVGGTASGAALNLVLSPVVLDALKTACVEKKVIPTQDDQAKRIQEEQNALDAANTRRETCFNGIAKKLAKDQLTAMTRSTVNWINSGFNGDPMYVRNITSFTNSLERNILEREINKLSDPNRAYPYGTDFSRSVINSYKTGASFRVGFGNFTDYLTSDLGAFLIPDYSSVGTYGVEDTKTAQQRATEANERFANDFSVGGWDGWNALTQRDQNNPLGFTMLASQSLSDQESEKIEETKEELATNDGVLSQKKCVLYERYELVDDEVQPVLEISADGEFKTATSKTMVNKEYDKCVKYEVVTPGSVIQDQISTTLDSPKRQLELAKDINDVLNSLFSVLLDKLYSQGLSGISSGQYEFGDNMGIGEGSNNWANDSEFFGDSIGSGYINGSFDLTRDLGNTYIHGYIKSGGKWDAQNNIPGLYPNTAPGDGKGGKGGSANVAYTVSVAGNTKLINNGYNGWAVGDKAFWNGKEWQNWKAGTANPIKDRGVIQMQKDYVVAGKEILKFLPTVMPKIGELDYCIPGPNPNWDANSAETDLLFQEYASTLSYTEKTGGFLERNQSDYSIARQGDPAYDNFKNVFNWTNPEWWQRVISNPLWRKLNVLGDLPTVTGKDNIREYNQQQIIHAQEEVSRNIENFRKVFGQQMSYLYGKNSLMLKPFIENEKTGELAENTRYLPMAEAGLNITKDILSYDEDIKTATQDYQDAIIQANSNVYKLDAIRKRVNSIIKTAQDRRDAKLLEILKEETIRVCQQKKEECLITHPAPSLVCQVVYNSCISNVMTPAQYKEKYKDCLEEESITYYDENDLMGSTGDTEERCKNKMDDDLDGSIDMADSDCRSGGGGEIPPGGGGGDVGYCNNDVTTSNTLNEHSASCATIKIESECNSHIHYQKNKETTCIWSPDGSGGTTGTSTYGCQIDPDISGHTTTHSDNTHCDRRTESECTATFYYTNSKQYTCEFLQT